MATFQGFRTFDTNSCVVSDTGSVPATTANSLAIIPNIHHGGDLRDPHNISISHSASTRPAARPIRAA